MFTTEEPTSSAARTTAFEYASSKASSPLLIAAAGDDKTGPGSADTMLNPGSHSLFSVLIVQVMQPVLDSGFVK